MDSFVQLVGHNIRNIRNSKKLTLDELAEKCGLQTSYLAGIERGERNITLQTLEKIIIGLEEGPVNFFRFSNLNLVQNDNNKDDLIVLLLNLIENKSVEEISLILNVANEIFNTYEGK